MSQYLSDKIRVLSFVSIILVLYIHSGFHADEIYGMPEVDFVQHLISGMLGRLAVPLFFIISGYLFFLKVPDGIASVFSKMRKRVRTLLVPYLIGCSFFVISLQLISLLPGAGKYMNSVSSFFSLPIGELLVGTYYASASGAPFAFQLWFLRDLIIIVAVSPVLYYGLKELKWWLVAILFALSFTGFSFLNSAFWFSLGGCVAMSMLVSREICDKLYLITGGVTGCVFAFASALELLSPELSLWGYLRMPIVLCGLAFLWVAYDFIAGHKFALASHPSIAAACGFTFFIYLFHEPTLNIIRKLFVAAVGRTSWGYMASYLLSPWLFAAFAIVAGLLLRRYAPRFYSVLVGGR